MEFQLLAILSKRRQLKNFTNALICMLIYTRSLIWPATGPHYLLTFGSEKIGPRTIKLAFITQRQNVTKVALFVLLN